MLRTENQNFLHSRQALYQLGTSLTRIRLFGDELCCWFIADLESMKTFKFALSDLPLSVLFHPILVKLVVAFC